MADRKEIIKQYKQTVQPMGIYQIRNLINGKILVGSNLNLRAIENRFGFMGAAGFLGNTELQNDCLKYGKADFALEIIDKLDPKEDPAYDYREDLKTLEEMWIEKLQPFGEKGYNIPKK